MDNEIVESNQPLIWPAIIKYPGDAELLYVNSQVEWNSDAGLHSFNYDETDYLIDSAGNTFALTQRVGNMVQPESLNKNMPLDEILGLIKAHAAQTGACCIAKLYAPSISEAFKMVKSLSDR